jgi:hypothetical protein
MHRAMSDNCYEYTTCTVLLARATPALSASRGGTHTVRAPKLMRRVGLIGYRGVARMSSRRWLSSPEQPRRTSTHILPCRIWAIRYSVMRQWGMCLRWNRRRTQSRSGWCVCWSDKHNVLEGKQVWGEWGANILCKRGAKAVKVTKLMVTSSQATNTFHDDTERRPFFVPAGLLRMEVPIQTDYLVEKAARTSARSRAAVCRAMHRYAVNSP